MLLVSGLLSCSKNKLEDINLEGNQHEEFEMMVPVKISNIGTFSPTPGNYRAVVSFVVAPEYLSLVEVKGRPYEFILQRDGLNKDTEPSSANFFNDGVVFQQTYTYTVSIRFIDNGFVTQQSAPEIFYVSGN